MANVLLTTSCVRHCPYCFAKTEMEGSPTSERLSWENVVYLADFLLASGEKRVSLLGGEPTLHPDFVDIVLYFIERGFFVTVFTSGVMNRAKLELCERYLASKSNALGFVCNLNDPEQTPAPEKERESVHHFLTVMGPLVTPGFNIYRTDFRLEFIFDSVVRYGLKRHLRLGIAHPIPGSANSYIQPEDMGRVIDRLHSYADPFDRLRITPGFDCGFPLCRVSNEQIGWLYRVSQGHISFGCGMPLDITPDMSIYNCFPLSNYQRRSLFEFNTLQDVQAFYQKMAHAIRNEIPGIFDECDGCIHREEQRCAGGGVCQLLGRMMSEPPVRLQEINDGLAALRSAV